MNKRQKRRPRLTISKILRWADAHFERTGRWPGSKSGPIADAPGETWSGVSTVLRKGCRGFVGGETLAEILVAHRFIRRSGHVAQLTIAKIVTWARSHFRRTGRFPTARSGPVTFATGETWQGIDLALRQGHRGLRCGSSLAKLLAARLGVRNRTNRPPLRVKDILKWADAYFARYKQWPRRDSGAVAEVPGETWKQIHRSLRDGKRGLPRSGSLIQFLSKHGRLRNRRKPPPLSIKRILLWADAHCRRTGFWPRPTSGPVVGVDGESWRAIAATLTRGGRGLRGGGTLSQLLCRHRRVRPYQRKPSLTVREILAWADAYYARSGRWPSGRSGTIAEDPSHSWWNIDSALRNGHLGLPGGSSLKKLLSRRRPPVG